MAKSFDPIFIDNINKPDAKTEEFEKLRNDFPNTFFFIIFHKAAAGTIRVGSSIKFSRSAAINVVRNEDERVAVMEKGRYGTIGWNYFMSEGKMMKEG